MRPATSTKLFGRGTPAVAAVGVNLQRYAAGGWHIVARTRTGRYGWYAFTRPAAGTYRAVIAPTAAFARSYSPTLKLR